MAKRAGRKRIVFATDEPSVPVLGIAVIAPQDIAADDEVVIAIGDSSARQRIEARHPGLNYRSLFAATAIIGDDVEIGPGAVFCDQSIVTASARIGKQFQCNIYSYVAHDCVIGDFVTFAPKVSCNGNVHIGDGVYVGAGAVIRNGTPDQPISIGEGAFIAMGALVTSSVPAGAKVYGARPHVAINPCDRSAVSMDPIAVRASASVVAPPVGAAIAAC